MRAEQQTKAGEHDLRLVNGTPLPPKKKKYNPSLFSLTLADPLVDRRRWSSRNAGRCEQREER